MAVLASLWRSRLHGGKRLHSYCLITLTPQSPLRMSPMNKNKSGRSVIFTQLTIRICCAGLMLKKSNNIPLPNPQISLKKVPYRGVGFFRFPRNLGCLLKNTGGAHSQDAALPFTHRVASNLFFTLADFFFNHLENWTKRREARKWMDDEVQTLLCVFQWKQIQTLSLQVYERIANK